MFRWLTAALFILTVAAIAFATFGAFDAIHKAGNDPITRKAIENGYAIHIALGSATVLAMLLLPIVAWRGHLGPTNLKWSGALATLGIIQAILGSGESVPALGLLHGLVAVAIVVVTGALAHRTWTDDMTPRNPANRTSLTAPADARVPHHGSRSRFPTTQQAADTAASYWTAGSAPSSTPRPPSTGSRR
jgi:heme A synthase